MFRSQVQTDTFFLDSFAYVYIIVSRCSKSFHKLSSPRTSQLWVRISPHLGHFHHWSTSLTNGCCHSRLEWGNLASITNRIWIDNLSSFVKLRVELFKWQGLLKRGTRKFSYLTLLMLFSKKTMESWSFWQAKSFSDHSFIINLIWQRFWFNLGALKIEDALEDPLYEISIRAVKLRKKVQVKQSRSQDMFSFETYFIRRCTNGTRLLIKIQEFPTPTQEIMTLIQTLRTVMTRWPYAFWNPSLMIRQELTYIMPKFRVGLTTQ